MAHITRLLGRVTRYDALGRVSQQIANYVDGVSVASELITDLITLYAYDAPPIVQVSG